MSDLAYVGLGSNLGDRLAHLRAAVAGLGELAQVEVAAVSAAYESDPVGYVDQPRFLNGAVALDCGLTPHDLLARLQDIEQSRGRERLVRWGPRTLDLDLLVWGDRLEDTPRLQLPHPRLLERDFALVPVLEIAPDLRHPVTGRSLAEHAAELTGGSGLRRVEPISP